VGNGALVEPLAIGIAFITLNSRHVLTLKDCLYLPYAFRNVVSIPRLVRDGYKLSFTFYVCRIHYYNDVVGMGIMVNGLYILEWHESVRQMDVNVASTSNGKCSRDDGVDLKHLWHLRLNHINERKISKLDKRGLIDQVGSESGPTCESCLLGKNG